MLFKHKIQHPDLNNLLTEIDGALAGMAAHPGDLRARLEWAYTEGQLHKMRLYKLPDELRAEVVAWGDSFQPKKPFDTDAGSFVAGVGELDDAQLPAAVDALAALRCHLRERLDMEEGEAYDKMHGAKTPTRR